MRTTITVVALALATATPAFAQDAIERAIQQQNREVVRLLEKALFDETEKTATVLYAKQVRSQTYRYCGEAMLGSSRRAKFAFDFENSIYAIDPKPAEIAKVGCNVQGGRVLLDMR